VKKDVVVIDMVHQKDIGVGAAKEVEKENIVVDPI
jgi:hypothetical protein